MKPSKLLLIVLGYSLLFTACGKKSETKEPSLDQQTFASFSADTFKEGQNSVQFTEATESQHSIIIKQDMTLEISYNATLGYVSGSAPEKTYKNTADAEVEAIEAATKGLTPKDSYEKWEKTKKTAREKVKKDLVPISCSLKISGKNLTPKDDAVVSSNEKGRIARMDFEIVEVKGVPYKTTATLPGDIHKKHCVGEKFLEYMKISSSKQNLTPQVYFSTWFSLGDDDNFLTSKKGMLSFNVMSSTKLIYSSVVLEKK